jgi:hypothetical protein
MVLFDVLSILTIVAIIVATVGFGRMAWRILSGHEQFEPGGSYGRQAVGRYHEERKAGQRDSVRRRLAGLVKRG